LAQITVELTHASADRLDDPALESMRAGIPAARGLPMLRSIALVQDDHGAQNDHLGGRRHVVLDYLDDLRLSVSVAP
jgi:hypothetical protein